MKYYFVMLAACRADFDEQCTFIREPRFRVENVGLEFDSWPPDDLFSSTPEVFCTTRLKSNLETPPFKLTGIESFEKVQRISTQANWQAFYGDTHPGEYWQVKINGVPMQDDIAYWEPPYRFIVMSERLILYLAPYQVVNLRGFLIEEPLDNFFQKYLKSNGYKSAKRLLNITINDNQL